jgi:salicylate hydroxylase
VSYPVNDSLVNMGFFIADPSPWPDASRLTLPGKREDIASAVEGWSSAVRGLASLFPNEPVVWGLFDMYEHPAPSYVEAGGGGRVCIAGDAAHASTPHHGAGATMGVEDALALTAAVKFVVEKLQFAKMENKDEGEHSDHLLRAKARYLAAALRTFSDVRYERSQWLVRSSRDGGLIYEWQYPRSLDDPIEIQREFDERFEKIRTFDVDGMVQQVRNKLSSAVDEQK